MIGTSHGDWTELLVGHVAPTDSNLAILSAASSYFGNVATGFRGYEDQLQRVWSGVLTDQEGRTADAGRAAFQQGVQLARETADRYDVIQGSSKSAHSSASDLRSELLTIAENGNCRIRQIQQSSDSLPIKIGRITEVVVDCQTQANAKAAACAGDLLTQIQQILDKQGIQVSSRQFARDNGFDTTRMFGSPNTEVIRNRVETTLNLTGSPDGTQALGNPVPPPNAPAPSPENTAPTNIGLGTTQIPSVGTATQSTAASAPPNVGQGSTQLPSGVPSRPPAVPAPTVPPTPQAPTAGPPQISAPGMPSPSVGVPPGGLPLAGTVPPTPTTLAQSFSQGFQTGAPLGAAAAPVAALPPTLSDTSMPMAPPVAQAFPSNTHTPILDLPTHAPAAATAAPVSVTPADAGSAYLAGAPPPPTPVTSTAAQLGPLPSYGSDIRPTTTTAPAAPSAPAGPAPAAPSSGPGNPQSNVNQPAVVRQQPTTPTSTTPAAVGAQAVATSTTGAAAGHASTQTAARTRLQSLVYAVARQEPRLSWAVGDRPDQSTVLVTDLAAGWIPPGIDIPANVSLLDPKMRRGDVEALLGEVRMAASYAPGQHLPTETQAVPISPRARHGQHVDELGWELSQATKWRDGLPRLAHTLATAAARATGVLTSEIDLLREHLDSVRTTVLDSYPHRHDTTAIENWQLLATIEALVMGERAHACYHFAWFQALSRVTAGGQKA